MIIAQTVIHQLIQRQTTTNKHKKGKMTGETPTKENHEKKQKKKNQEKTGKKQEEETEETDESVGANKEANTYI